MCHSSILILALVTRFGLSNVIVMWWGLGNQKNFISKMYCLLRALHYYSIETWYRREKGNKELRLRRLKSKNGRDEQSFILPHNANSNLENYVKQAWTGLSWAKPRTGSQFSFWLWFVLVWRGSPWLNISVCFLLFATCYLLQATCYLPLATCPLPLATCHLLLVTY